MGGGGEGENLADVKWTGGSKKGEDVIKSWYQLPRDSRSLSALLHTWGEGPVPRVQSSGPSLVLHNSSFLTPGVLNSNPKVFKIVQIQNLIKGYKCEVHKSRKSSYVAKAIASF